MRPLVSDLRNSFSHIIISDWSLDTTATELVPFAIKLFQSNEYKVRLSAVSFSRTAADILCIN
jgi:hypothetical protein